MLLTSMLISVLTTGCDAGAVAGASAAGEVVEILVGEPAWAREGASDAAGGEIDPGAATAAPGMVVQLEAIDASGAPVRPTWATSDGSVATVSSAGLVTAVAPGTARITARTRTRAADAIITVVSAPSGDPGDASGSSTVIEPGDDIQAAVDAHPAGASFLLRAGVHRMRQVTPKDGNTFVGEPGAVMSGARLLTDVSREGGLWVAAGQTQQGQVHGRCADGFDGCAYPEDLFIDDRPLRQVLSIGEVEAGTWYFDYPGDRVYFADDPRGRKVEISVTRHAFVGAARDVTIRGLVIEKYANPAQHGAIHGADGTHGPLSTGWTVDANEIRLNHGVGVRIGDRMRVTGNRVHSNGQLGVGGIGRDVLVENNEISQNNRAGFLVDWEGGGTKFVKTDGLVVRGNFVHHNDGPGLWTDIDNIRTLYEGNRVEDNARAGIFHEISYAAVIRNNVVRRNGAAKGTWLWGAGILVAASPDVEIYGNRVEDNADGIGAVQQARGAGPHGPYEIENLHVHGNVVVMRTGTSGLAQDTGDDSYFRGRNNRFESNTYTLGSSARYFSWMNGERTETEWRGYGNDVTGEFFR